MLTIDIESAAHSLRLAENISVEAISMGIVKSVSGGTIVASGFHYPVGTGALVETNEGTFARAEVITVNARESRLSLLDQHAQISIGATVRASQIEDEIIVCNSMLGRIIDPLGEPLDGLGAITGPDRWPLKGKIKNPLQQAKITEQLDTGIRSINALVPIGKGQRISLIAGSGVGKSELLKQITRNSDIEVIVLGLVGERAREIGSFVEALQSEENFQRAVIVAAPASQAPLLRIKAAERAVAIAEYFCDQGKDVLLIIDSLTRVAHAKREIGLSAGEPPTVKGYPPSALSIIPELVERAGKDLNSGGSVTAIYSVLADSDDEHDPVVDSARAITDGHIMLSRRLAEEGVFPAIDISRSISRVANDLVSKSHFAVIKKFRTLLSAHEENRELVMMGAYQAGSDPLLDRAISDHDKQMQFLKQGQNEVSDIHMSIDTLVKEYAS